ncbi:MAG: class I SAM-dependent RNA methyltransferase [Pseudomonadota bacterium]
MKVKIEKLVHGGSGSALLDGKMVFVPYAVPGDEVEIEIVASHRGYDEAKIVKIVKPSDDRVEPECPVFGRCGGCQWQHISYDAQAYWKEKIVREALVRIGKIPDPNVLKIIPSTDQWHYRNRVQLHVDREGRVGFYAPKSQDVVEFDECLIAATEINEKLSELKPSLRGRDRGISIEIEERGGSFSQINSAQNERLKGLLCDWLRDVPHENVVELYAGNGNFSFELSKIAKQLLATDVDRKAIDHAKKRAKEEGIENLKFLSADARKSLNLLKEPTDCLVLDPPRKGCQDILEDIVRREPRAIIYVSCEPATLARDLKHLLEAGYKLEKVQPIDMFPQTFHIESVSLLLKI